MAEELTVSMSRALLREVEYALDLADAYIPSPSNHRSDSSTEYPCRCDRCVVSKVREDLRSALKRRGL